MAKDEQDKEINFEEEAFEELMKDHAFVEWYNQRPDNIKEVIRERPYNQLYVIKSTGQECYIVSYYSMSQATIVRERIGDLTKDHRVPMNIKDQNGKSLEDTEQEEQVLIRVQLKYPTMIHSQVFGLTTEDICTSEEYVLLTADEEDLVKV